MSWLFSKSERLPFHDKAWTRADLAAWDERWHRLSVLARKQFLNNVKAAASPQSVRPLNHASSFDPALVQEWRQACLVRDEERPRVSGFYVPSEALGFVSRLRALRRYSLLNPGAPSEVEKYISYAFHSYDLQQALDQIVEKQIGLSRYSLAGDLFQMFGKRRRWPDWVAGYLNDPLARPLLSAIEAAGGSLPLARLAEHVRGHTPAEVRQSADRLVNHLALFEDLDHDTGEIQIGLLPAVLQDRRRAAEGAVPPLQKAEPADAAPAGGILVPDLRAVLLELAGQPPRLRLNHTLYQKEEERFQSALMPLPEWLNEGSVGRTDPSRRLHDALQVARRTSLVCEVKGSGEAVLLDLTQEGRHWLALTLEEQYAQLFACFRESSDGQFVGDGDYYFLGSNISAALATGDRFKDRSNYYAEQTKEARQHLRDAFHRALGELPSGTFFTLKSFLRYASALPHNPLLLGRQVAEVVVRKDGRVVPPLGEFLEEVACTALEGLVLGRLAGLGCVQLAQDDRGRLLLARLPRLDVYFGKAEVTPSAPQSESTRVVVQPDFSVIIIGLNPAPMAELAPFCERVRGQVSAGSLSLRLTRESVLKGLAAGLPPGEVLARLEKHASTPVPKNVATELRGWCNWVRAVTPSPATLLRCPDSDTADRVMGVLGKHAERIAEKVVALAAEGLTTALRQKLQAQGILIEGGRKRKRD
jgi:hypothetical protein